MDAWQLARVSPPCIVMYQLLQNKPPKCATRNPVLCSILSIYKGRSNTFLASKSSWNQTTLDCNSSLLATSDQNCKSQDSIHLLLSQHSWHRMYNTLNEHNGSPPILFIGFPKTAVQYCSPSKFHRMHEETRSPARQSMSQVSNKL